MKKAGHQHKKAGKKTSPVKEHDAQALDLFSSIKGLDPKAAADQTADAETARRIIEALPSDYEDAKELIMALYKKFPEKAVAKAARKTAFRLRERGLSLEELGIDAEDRRIVPKQLDKLTGLMGPAYDLRGTRVILVVRDSPLKGLEIAMGMASRVDGLRDFTFRPVSKKGFPSLMEHVNSSLGPLVEAEIPLLIRLLEDAFAAGDYGGTVPFGYRSARPLLLKLAPPLERPFEEVKATAAKEDLIMSEEDALRLLSAPPLNEWMPDPAAIEHYEDDIKAVFQSPIVLSDLSRRERERELRAEMAKGIFEEGLRKKLADMLYETAFYFSKRADEDLSTLARRAGYTMEKTLTEKTNPFLDALIVKGIDLIKETLSPEEGPRDEAGTQSKLIISP
jgi:hypothetical protein